MSVNRGNCIGKVWEKPSNDPRFDSSNGRIFSDSIYASEAQKVTGIQVTIGDQLLNSLQFIYDNNPDLSECYGGSDGRFMEQKFDDDEYITRFSWISGFNTYYAGDMGAFTWHVQVTTNKGLYTFGDVPSSIRCGGKKTYTVEADEGYRIVGIRCKARRNDRDAQPDDQVGTFGRAVNTLFAISHVYQSKL